jgi:hypothetical protein
MHEAFAGGVNVWMAYDWVYPPGKGGEALIRVDWGNDYELTKPYWVFRQWASALAPGMHVVEANAGAAEPDVKPTAFLWADGKSIVIHVVNMTDEPRDIVLGVSGAVWRTVPAARQRTSATEDLATLAPLAADGNGISDTLPARSLTTYRMTRK